MCLIFSLTKHYLAGSRIVRANRRREIKETVSVPIRIVNWSVISILLVADDADKFIARLRKPFGSFRKEWGTTCRRKQTNNTILTSWNLCSTGYCTAMSVCVCDFFSLFVWLFWLFCIVNPAEEKKPFRLAATAWPRSLEKKERTHNAMEHIFGWWHSLIVSIL